jgi:hypothetical protein
MASIKQSLLDTILDFISRRKVKSLENAFRKNDKLLDAIKTLDKTYVQMDRMLEDFCKKYPDGCKDAEDRRKKLR